MDREQLREELPHLAAGYEAAVVEALSRKLLRAVDLHDAPAAVVAGGVAANALLRRTLEKDCAKIGTRLVVPPPDLCTDNAAMIGAAAAALDRRPLPRIPLPQRPQRLTAGFGRSILRKTRAGQHISTPRPAGSAYQHVSQGSCASES